MQRRYLHAPVAFDWKDPLGASNMYTEDELAIAETAESYCQERLLPRVLGMLAIMVGVSFLTIEQRHIARKTTTRRS